MSPYATSNIASSTALHSRRRPESATVDLCPAGFGPRQCVGLGTGAFVMAAERVVAIDAPLVVRDRPSVTRSAHAGADAIATGADHVSEARSAHGEAHGTSDAAMGPRGEWIGQGAGANWVATHPW